MKRWREGRGGRDGRDGEERREGGKGREGEKRRKGKGREGKGEGREACGLLNPRTSREELMKTVAMPWYAKCVKTKQVFAISSAMEKMKRTYIRFRENYRVYRKKLMEHYIP